uniref:Neur_chan_memb domain-containing protein n=1 Tax=Gongylonema pulchrum TaxID=637853 RepID=A0A183CXD3_9BILA
LFQTCVCGLVYMTSTIVYDVGPHIFSNKWLLFGTSTTQIKIPFRYMIFHMDDKYSDKISATVFLLIFEWKRAIYEI